MENKSASAFTESALFSLAMLNGIYSLTISIFLWFGLGFDPPRWADPTGVRATGDRVGSTLLITAIIFALAGLAAAYLRNQGHAWAKHLITALAILLPLGFGLTLFVIKWILGVDLTGIFYIGLLILVVINGAILWVNLKRPDAKIAL